jgi:hypothetical protein
MQLGKVSVIACECHTHPLFASLCHGVALANLNVLWRFAVRPQTERSPARAATPSETFFNNRDTEA